MTNKFDYHTTNLAILAARYAMGKSTPAAWQVIEAMKAKWAEIAPNTQAQIVKEIAKDLPTAIIADDVHAEWMEFLEWEKNRTTILLLVHNKLSGLFKLSIAADKSAIDALLESDPNLGLSAVYPPMLAAETDATLARWQGLWEDYRRVSEWIDLPSDYDYVFQDCARIAEKP